MKDIQQAIDNNQHMKAIQLLLKKILEHGGDALSEYFKKDMEDIVNDKLAKSGSYVSRLFGNIEFMDFETANAPVDEEAIRNFDKIVSRMDPDLYEKVRMFRSPDNDDQKNLFLQEYQMAHYQKYLEVFRMECEG